MQVSTFAIAAIQNTFTVDVQLPHVGHFQSTLTTSRPVWMALSSLVQL